MLQDFLLNIRARLAERKARRLGARQERRRAEERAAARFETEEREPPYVVNLINQWWDRLFASVYRGGLSQQEEQYASHLTKRDYLWNTVGTAAWSLMLPLLSMVATWVVGVEDAGRLSMAFVVGNLLMFMATYGVRTYQVSDVYEEYSFSDYRVTRFLSCAVTLMVGYVYCRIRAYDSAMLTTFMAVIVFRVIDSLADVYDGRLQQMDKFYLAGISQAVRCVAGMVVFSVVLLVTHRLGAASVALAVAGAASLIFLTLPLALLETPKSDPMRFTAVRAIVRDGLPLFVALFLYSVIDSMPKFAMEGVLSYDNQLYFNLMYFPAHAILSVTGIVYKPQLLRLASAWDTPSERHHFDKIITAMLGVIVGITVVMLVVMATAGIPLTSLVYKIDFEAYRIPALAMIVTGGLCAAIEFLYQVITVLRKQDEVMRFYVGVFILSVPVSVLLVRIFQLNGAVAANVVIMAILFACLIGEYVHIRRSEDTKAHPDADDLAYLESE